MKRAQKLALLSKFMQGKATSEDLKQIQRSNGAGGVVIQYEPGKPEPGPDDEVTFTFKGQRVTMPRREIKAFTHYEPLTIVLMPDNHRRKVPII